MGQPGRVEGCQAALGCATCVGSTLLSWISSTELCVGLPPVLSRAPGHRIHPVGADLGAASQLLVSPLSPQVYFFSPWKPSSSSEAASEPCSPQETFCIYSQQGTVTTKPGATERTLPQNTHSASRQEDRCGPGSVLGSSCCRTAPLASMCCFSSLFPPPLPLCFLVQIVFLLAHKADKIRRRFLRAQNRFLVSCPSCKLPGNDAAPPALPGEPRRPPPQWVGAEKALISHAIPP